LSKDNKYAKIKGRSQTKRQGRKGGGGEREVVEMVG
jgi:hypothetical protein